MPKVPLATGEQAMAYFRAAKLGYARLCRVDSSKNEASSYNARRRAILPPRRDGDRQVPVLKY